MALIELNLNPSQKELRWFGVLALIFFTIIGGIVYAAEAQRVAIGLCSAGLLFCLIYYAIRPARIVMYRGWLKLFQPVGWAVSHVLLGAIFFVVFTLIGLCLRLFRYDPMQRRRREAADTYWVEHRPARDPSRYFRQF